MEKNIKLVIEYDGTDFNGWQVQPNGRTVQGEIQKALTAMTQRPVVVNGSGRTDAGVHALGQTANYRCDTTISAPAFHRGLNSLLPEDIVIHACDEVNASFHARYDVQHKCYQYRLLNREHPSAVGRRYAWHIRKPLNVAAMEDAAAKFVGRYDFKAFEAAGSPRSHTVRHVTESRLDPAAPDHLIFTIAADGFLRYMVRNLMGTLVAIGLEKMVPADIESILASKDRRRAAATAPPHGLFLVWVTYKS